MKKNVHKISTTVCCLLFVISALSQVPFSDDFNGTVLDSRWIIINPNADSRADLTGAGELLLRASPLNGGSDLWPPTNSNAPRIFQPVDSNGSWKAEMKFHSSLSGNYQGAGLLAITGTDYLNVNNQWRILEKLYNTNNNIAFGWNLCSPVVYNNQQVYFRIVYDNSYISISYSSDGISWSQPCTYSQKVYYIGIFSVRQAYNGLMDLYTNALVDYIRFTNYFEFTGSGNWDIINNWKNGITPPSLLQGNSEIIINPSGDSECILNVSQTIMPGGKVRVIAEKNLTITGDLRIEL